MGEKALTAHFGGKWNLQPVENGGQMSLGKRTLNFLETRMLHWPDSMFAYCPEEKVLFSSDAFGQHFAGLERFDDEIGEAIMPHAKKYYANILLPYSTMVLKLVEKIEEMGLAFEVICPDHGIMWRREPGKIIEAYVQWAHQNPARKAVVVYDTMWHSTARMAEAIVEGLGQAKVHTQLMDLRACHRSDVMTEVLDAGAVLVGSPTLNNGLFPTVADFLCYMKGLRPANKIGAAFGSYGWSGESVKLIKKELEEMKFQVIDPVVKTQYVPDESDLEACYNLGLSVAEALP
jgi:flavorubredoxin